MAYTLCTTKYMLTFGFVNPYTLQNVLQNMLLCICVKYCVASGAGEKHADVV